MKITEWFEVINYSIRSGTNGAKGKYFHLLNKKAIQMLMLGAHLSATHRKKANKVGAEKSHLKTDETGSNFKFQKKKNRKHENP